MFFFPLLEFRLLLLLTCSVIVFVKVAHVVDWLPFLPLDIVQYCIKLAKRLLGWLLLLGNLILGNFLLFFFELEGIFVSEKVVGVSLVYLAHSLKVEVFPLMLVLFPVLFSLGHLFTHGCLRLVLILMAINLPIDEQLERVNSPNVFEMAE